MNLRPNPHMRGPDLEGLHWPLPTSHLLSHCSSATLAMALLLHYARQVLILAICNVCSLFLVYYGHRSVRGSFTSHKSQFRCIFSSDRHFLINQTRVAIPPLNVLTITLLLYYFLEQLWYPVYSFVYRGPLSQSEDPREGSYLQY